MKGSLVILSKLLIIGWASVWIAALPLFHTHVPDAFEKPVGLPHTVFSSDLPGEFSAFNHRTAKDDSELSPLSFNSEELGFIASASLDDGKRKPLEQTACLFFFPVTASAHVAFRFLRPVTQSDPLWSPHSYGLRAPPAPASA
jgi:hypothetical protein